jgi:hypothetical protein
VWLYHNSRPHQALERNSPTPRDIEVPEKGKVIAIPKSAGCIIAIDEPPKSGVAGRRDNSARIHRRRITSKGVVRLIANRTSTERNTNCNFEVEIGFVTTNIGCLHA